VVEPGRVPLDNPPVTRARTRARRPDTPEPGEPEKRRAILHAAVRVFAEKGYHGCRIADVARAAGVAYGLVYHYFRSKEELLESVFAEQWAILVNALRAIDEGPGTSPEKLEGMLRFVFDVYKTAPAAVRVLILEVARTPHALRAGSTRETFEAAVSIVADVVRQGQARGELRPDLDPMVSAASVLGAVELAVTAMVVGLVPAGDEKDVDRARAQVAALALGGLRPR
jgi:TetR/AcrR family fatty acid metabolism transcriptional regulator